MSPATPHAATLLADRALVRLSGPDVRGFLQGLVTNDVAGALPVWAGLLSAQGKALFDFLVWDDGEDLLLDCEAAQVEGLIRRLSLYRLRRPIVIAHDPSRGVHWRADGEDGVADPRLAALGRRWIGAPAGDGADAAWLAHRLGHGVVEGAAELGQDRTLWLETNAGELNGVSFTKGCYVGQENTARMNWRQKVNRRLVVVRDGGDAAEDSPRAAYPALGLAVRHRRVGTLAGDSSVIVPAWLERALATPEPEGG